MNEIWLLVGSTSINTTTTRSHTIITVLYTNNKKSKDSIEQIITQIPTYPNHVITFEPINKLLAIYHKESKVQIIYLSLFLAKDLQRACREKGILKQKMF